jgi:hypothetical protein
MNPLVLMTALLIEAPALKEVRKPDKQPQGEWCMERIDQNGHSEELRDYAFASERQFGYGFGGVVTRWDASFFRVDGEGQVDFISEWGQNKLSKGIWKIEGDRLMICMSHAGGMRPSEFAAPRGNARLLYVLRRVEK